MTISFDEKKKISIVTVCYNAEKVIRKTIESVLNQTCPVYEYIIIDGGSDDGTYGIVKSYIKTFSEKGIRFLHLSEKDRGISDAFNKGIKLTSGEWIGLINADDELVLDACHMLQNAICSNDSDIVYGNCIWVDTKLNRQYISKPKGDLSNLLYTMNLIHPSVFVKKEVYEKIRGFNVDYKYCMDMDFLYRAYAVGMKFFYLNKELTYFKSGGVSDNNLLKVVREVKRVSINNGANRLKVECLAIKSIIKNRIVKILKYTPWYLKYKSR